MSLRALTKLLERAVLAQLCVQVITRADGPARTDACVGTIQSISKIDSGSQTLRHAPSWFILAVQQHLLDSGDQHGWSKQKMLDEAILRSRTIAPDVDITEYHEFSSASAFKWALWERPGLHDSVKRSKFKAKLHDRTALPPSLVGYSCA